jgi:pimeloyl-ACP methyl ester carboxylesterase
LRKKRSIPALALLPQARHVRLEGLGHALFMQQPQPVLEVISQAREWLLASGRN